MESFNNFLDFYGEIETCTMLLQLITNISDNTYYYVTWLEYQNRMQNIEQRNRWDLTSFITSNTPNQDFKKIRIGEEDWK